jgi:hypothetical protein
MKKIIILTISVCILAICCCFCALIGLILSGNNPAWCNRYELKIDFPINFCIN